MQQIRSNDFIACGWLREVGPRRARRRLRCTPATRRANPYQRQQKLVDGLKEQIQKALVAKATSDAAASAGDLLKK